VLRGFARLVSKEPGFDPRQVLTLEAAVSPDRYPEGTSVRRFLDPVLTAIRRIPGVESAAAISLIPYENWGWNFNVRYEGQPGEDPTRLPMVERRVATADFFRVTGQRLLAGRLLGDGDDGRAQRVVVANEALAKRDFPGRDPVGQRYHTGDTTFNTIVGVVSDIRNRGPVDEPAPEIYEPYAQGDPGASLFPIMVRVKGDDPNAVARAVRAAIRAVDPGAAVTRVQPMTDLMARSVGRPRFYLTLLAVFAGVAVLLAMAGLYGVMSYAVAQRTRELGIRSALGSPALRTVGLVARQGMRLVSIGVVLGVAGGVGATGLLEGMLYGVSPVDAPTWAISTAALAVVGLVATLVPAMRATRVDPLVAIRAE
jgi:putative ABC transport system permease protein